MDGGPRRRGPIDSEIMLHDARTLEPGARLEADVCIVGGGPVGLTLAEELASPRSKVIVLESGSHEPGGEEAIDDLSRGRARGPLLGRSNRYLEATRRRRLGGLAGAWHRTCRALDAEDFAQRAWVARSGWPLSANELDPYYERARRRLGLASPPAPAGLMPDGDRFREEWLAYAPAEALGSGGHGSIAAATDLDVFAGATAVSLDLEDSEGGGEVAAVTARCIDGPELEVRARHFVLAAGAIENARLLLASTGQRAAGLGNEHDLVGRFFMDQILLRAGSAILPASGAAMTAYEEPGNDGMPAARAVLRASAAFQQRHELLNCLVFFQSEDGERQGRRPQLDSAVERATSGVLGMAGRAGSSRGYRGAVTLRGEQRPNRASRLVLGQDRDALGMPRVDLFWQLSDHDSWSLRTTARLLGEALGRRHLGRLQMRVAENRTRQREFGWSGHQSGTTRMSRDPSQGVVNPDCRVHDVPNLFVAGGSVFPTSGCSGPMLTSMALAFRLGDHLRRRLDA